MCAGTVNLNLTILPSMLAMLTTGSQMAEDKKQGYGAGGKIGSMFLASSPMLRELAPGAGDDHVQRSDSSCLLLHLLLLKSEWRWFATFWHLL